MTHALFIYGTLREPAVQQEVFGRSLESRSDHLDGYGLTDITVEGKRYPDLVVEEDAAVKGDVVELNDDELRRADEYETDAYERRTFVLASGTVAYAYIGKKGA
jgi:gamma-glutamylcyclotransferase (GGCT)/AIG2-like uncharacterized protein YtfP